MQTRPMTASTKAGLLVGLSIGLILLLLFSDAVSNAKYNARAASCKANFRQIKIAMQLYKASHIGQMPPSLKTLVPIIGSTNVFLCPDTGWEAAPITESTPYAHREVSYEYRYLYKPRVSDVICWDSHPHRPQHSVFVWLNRDNRNVLLADGHIKNLQEEDFQRLYLQGKNWVIQ